MAVTHFPEHSSSPLVSVYFDDKTYVYTLIINSPPDNRLSTSLIKTALTPSLSYVEDHWRYRQEKELSSGALVIAGNGKFFSNGLAYKEDVLANPSFFVETLNPFLLKLTSFPLPLVAAMNGHAMAGGFLLALLCDVRVSRQDGGKRAWSAMNEVDFGAPLPPSFAALLRYKLGGGPLLHRIALIGEKINGSDLLHEGIAMQCVPEGSEISTAQTIAASLAVKSKAGAVGLIRTNLMEDFVRCLGLDRRVVMPIHEQASWSKIKSKL